MVVMISRFSSFTSCLIRKASAPAAPIEGAPAGEAAVVIFHRAAVHAGLQLVGEGEMLDPVDPQRQPLRRRGRGEKGGAGPVGEHPAQEIGIEGEDAADASSSAAFSGVTAANSSARMKVEASSEPVATALSVRPSATFRAAYLSALIPERQMPDMLATSQGALASSPCTIRPCPGMS